MSSSATMARRVVFGVLDPFTATRHFRVASRKGGPDFRDFLGAGVKSATLWLPAQCPPVFVFGTSAAGCVGWR